MRGARARRLLAWVLGVTFYVVAGVAFAQPAGLPAVISVGGSGLDAAAVESAVEHELGVPLVIDPSAAERLEIAMTGRRANVTYYAPGREPVTRSVDLPRDTQRALETIAFLAGNLARDEASELLRQLTPVAPGGEPDEVPRPPPPPPSPPPPPPPAAKPGAPAAKPALVRVKTKPSAPTLIEPRPLAANVSLLYPTATLDHTERRRINLELTLLSSRLGAVRGAALGFGYLRVDGPVEGFSYALVWNRAGPVTGVQLADFVVEGHGTLHGLSYADFVNVRDGDIHGLQASGIYVNGSNIHGVQAGVIVGVARDVHGVQASAIVAVAKNVEGVQASVVNVAQRVDGLQIGLVNVADEVHGGALGLVSVAKNGRYQPTAWFSGPSGTLNVGMKSVIDLTYTELAVGFDPFNERYRSDLGIGVHLDLGHHLSGETGFGYDETHDVRGDELVRGQVRYDLRLGFEPVHGFTPFVGGSLGWRVGGRGAPFRGEYSVGLAAF